MPDLTVEIACPVRLALAGGALFATSILGALAGFAVLRGLPLLSLARRDDLAGGQPGEPTRA